MQPSLPRPAAAQPAAPGKPPDPAGTELEEGDGGAETVEPPGPAPSRRPLWAVAAVGGAALIAAPLLLSGGGSAADPAPAAQARPAGRQAPLSHPTVQQPLVPQEFATAAAAPSSTAGSLRPASPQSPGRRTTSPQPRTAVPSAPPTTSSRRTAGAAKPGTKKAPAARPASAAEAVTRLVAAVKQSGVSPGRHVCYRAYVTDVGWQEPVCDGDVAGAAGGSRAIEELDVAAFGTNGTSGSAYVQSLEWLAWTGAADKADLYVGTAGRALRLEALAMRVGSGSVCLNADVQNAGYQGYRCNKEGGYTSAGTTGKSLRIEAIRITV